VAGLRLVSYFSFGVQGKMPCSQRGSPSVLGIQGRGQTTFCGPVSSEGLGSPPARPYGGPGRLRTLGKWKELGYDGLFNPFTNESDGYCINSVRNGILLNCSIHRYFNAYEVAINPDV